ncbi:peptidoglycan DD-metalloendopeptidase family protein [Verticiella sediminum]|nr:peptidoglycan DD-metalloendopeptidase family protein [Verticiella sediminum]
MLSTGLGPIHARGMLRLSGVMLAGAWLLAACTAPTRAPITDMSAQQPPVEATSPEAGGAGASSYVIRPGDTLYSISRAHNVPWQDLARWNNITDPSQLRVGQSLRIEGGASAPTQVQPPTGVAQVEPIGGSGVQTRPVPGIGGAPDATPATPAPTDTQKPAPANTSGIDWLWPANGKIVAQFNASLNKGVDIEGAVGDPVVAAADGIVVYSGSGLRGYGNLLIVRHNPTYLSAYAHNSVLLAKEGQQVRRGEKIAEMGQTDAPSPRLHFEIRRNGTPEDPMQYLPQR